MTKHRCFDFTKLSLKAFLIASLFCCPVNFAEAASFDCRKAITKTEKLICGDKELSELDTKMGEAYSTTVKIFPIKGFIESYQKIFLRAYSICAEEISEKETDAVSNCKEQVEEQIKLFEFLNTFDLIYGKEELNNGFDREAGIYVVKCTSEQCQLRAFGGWMPDAYHPSEKIEKGFYCDLELSLPKTKNGYTYKDGFRFVELDGDHLKSDISCSPRNALNDEFKEPLFRGTH